MYCSFLENSAFRTLMQHENASCLILSMLSKHSSFKAVQFAKLCFPTSVTDEGICTLLIFTLFISASSSIFLQSEASTSSFSRTFFPCALVKTFFSFAFHVNICPIVLSILFLFIKLNW